MKSLRKQKSSVSDGTGMSENRRGAPAVRCDRNEEEELGE